MLPDISCKEFFAVVMQCATFGPQLKAKTILLYSDNSATVDAITNMKAKSATMSKLLRELFYLCAIYSFQIKALHIAGVKNCLADCLSRPELRHKAWSLRPSLAKNPIQPTRPSMQW
jgi:hypothetical protein